MTLLLGFMISWSWTLVVTCPFGQISKFVQDNQGTEAKMIMHIGFVNLRTTVTTDNNIST